MITSENIPKETAIRKLTIVASLQCAEKNAGRKFTMVASSQRANKTGLLKFMIVASLQQCSWKPPAASKFLQRGGLGEAHLDLAFGIRHSVSGIPHSVLSRAKHGKS